MSVSLLKIVIPSVLWLVCIIVTVGALFVRKTKWFSSKILEDNRYGSIYAVFLFVIILAGIIGCISALTAFQSWSLSGNTELNYVLCVFSPIVSNICCLIIALNCLDWDWEDKKINAITCNESASKVVLVK